MQKRLSMLFSATFIVTIGLTSISSYAAGSLPNIATPKEPDAASLDKMYALMEKPATWDKIPKTVKFCYFSIDQSTKGPAYEYAMRFMAQVPRYRELAKKGGIDFNVTMKPPLELTIDLASPKLKRKASTVISFKPYTDERVAAEDFKANLCDGIAMSNIRARQFNSFVGSIDAIGAVPSYKHLTEVIKALAHSELSKYMVNRDYEITGIFPLGAAYFMVNDRKINSVAKAAGKKIAVLDFDKSQAKMVQRIGAQPVTVEYTSIGGKFNNGQVDIIAGPALIFNPFELYKGMTNTDGKVKGAIVRFPLIQLTGVMMLHRNKFPDGMGQMIREYSASQLDIAFDFINQVEHDIPAKYWMDVPQADKAGYIKLMREARISMTQEGFYDKKMMSLLKKIRCKLDPASYECSMTDE